MFFDSRMRFIRRLTAGLILIFTLLLGFSDAHARERLRLATTTSVQDSGLMPYLLADFERHCGCRVDVIAVGSGQALKIASNGDVDMVLVHTPALEKKFVEDGFGINRQTFMTNDFVILGPQADPARIRNMKDASKALSAIRESKALFISRGDASGTYRKEQELWEKAGIKPQGFWYLEIGQGMGMALTVADEKEAYTISDRSTYLARSKNLRLRVLVEGDPELINYYSAIQVNPARFSSIHAKLARQLIEWFTSPQGQNLIQGYQVNGHQLFKPVEHP